MTGCIAFVTDMHLAPVEAGDERAQSPLDRPARRADHLAAALAQIEERNPNAVLFGGDNANQPVSREAYRSVAATLMDKFPKPWHAIPGNHDVGSCVGWHHHDPTTMSQACTVFQHTFGPDHWAIETTGFRIIAANSQIFGADMPEARQQNQWLADELAVKTDLLRVVFIHTPPYLQSPEDDFDDGSEQMCLRPGAREPLLGILDRCPPDLLITAHAHRFWQRREPQWAWLGLPATAFGQHEMQAVPSHHLPAGDDAVGWVELQRADAGWKAVHHKLPDKNPPTGLGA